MAFISGVEGSFTYTDTAGIPAQASCFQWSGEFDNGSTPIRPFGFLLPTVVTGGMSLRGQIDFPITSGATAAPIPSGTSGTMSLISKGTQKYVFKAKIMRMTTGANSNTGSPELARYEFMAHADTSSDTITVT